MVISCVVHPGRDMQMLPSMLSPCSGRDDRAYPSWRQELTQAVASTYQVIVGDLLIAWLIYDAVGFVCCSIQNKQVLIYF
jgi:hypothetical protein